MKTFGCAGYAVYEYVVNEIYRDRGCFVEWDKDTAFDVADYFGIKESTVLEIVNYCCAVGLFEKELLASERVLTSKSIQERYVEACTITKRIDRNVPDRVRIREPDFPKTPEEIPKTPEVLHNVTKRNVTKHPPYPPPRVVVCVDFPFDENSPVMERVRSVIEDDALREAIRNWIRFMFDEKKILDAISIDLHLKDLLSFSSDPKKQLEIVNESVKCRWKRFVRPDDKAKDKSADRKSAFGKPEDYKKGSFG